MLLVCLYVWNKENALKTKKKGWITDYGLEDCGLWIGRIGYIGEQDVVKTKKKGGCVHFLSCVELKVFWECLKFANRWAVARF